MCGGAAPSQGAHFAGGAAPRAVGRAAAHGPDREIEPCPEMFQGTGGMRGWARRPYGKVHRHQGLRDCIRHERSRTLSDCYYRSSGCDADQTTSKAMKEASVREDLKS